MKRCLLHAAKEKRKQESRAKHTRPNVPKLLFGFEEGFVPRTPLLACLPHPRYSKDPPSPLSYISFKLPNTICDLGASAVAYRVQYAAALDPLRAPERGNATRS